ncbi:hypothetical protein IV73_GL000252 [Weissella kandleri]|uniref:Pore-forming protein n=1 Tax=Weissella kandleri TaxID=1616 RepID=A0A0R2JEH9_9LACO|nr:EbsA family protein [Weissella kandleri]KRN75753.1 hypothetical protein IV73_GL000252 [Weissella kandleri]
MRGFYQPAGLSGLVNWAWILMVGLLALILQLEFITFNGWTMLATLLFVFLVAVVILRRRIDVNVNYIHFRQLFSFNRLSIRFDGMKHVQPTRYGMMFDYNDNSYNMLISKKVRTQILKQLGV